MILQAILQMPTGNGETLINGIKGVYNGLQSMATSNASIVESQIYSWAAIGALLYIGGSLIGQIYSNQPINFLPYLRPFIILMLLPMGPRFCTAIDKFGDGIRNGMVSQNYDISTNVRKNAELMEKAVEEKWKRIGNDPNLYQEVMGNSMSEDDSFFGIQKELKIMSGRISDEVKLALVTFLQNLLVMAMYVAEACLLLLSVAFRLILRMGFPISITLAIFPGFTQALIHWFAKYLNFALLPAVAAMYSTISFKLLESYLSNLTANVNNLSATDLQNPDFLGYGYIALMLLCLIGYTTVPSMTSMLVTVGGVGSISGSISRNIKSPLSGAIRMGGNASIGTAKAVGLGTVGAATYLKDKYSSATSKQNGFSSGSSYKSYEPKATKVSPPSANSNPKV